MENGVHEAERLSTPPIPVKLFAHDQSGDLKKQESHRGLGRLNDQCTTKSRLGQAGACILLWLAAGCGPNDEAFESEVFSEVRVLGSRGNAPGQFVKPRSIAIDRDDNIYVCDMTGRIQKFDPDGNY
ncbi:MAG: hypothetical protein ACPHL9_10695, partial [Limisphaerales bacterium]